MATTSARTPKPPPLSRADVRGALVFVAVALVGSVGYLVLRGTPFKAPPSYAVDWKIQGTREGGRVLVVSSTETYVGLCDGYRASVVDEPEAGPVELRVDHVLPKSCQGDETSTPAVGVQTPDATVRLEEPLRGRRVTGPRFVPPERVAAGTLGEALAYRSKDGFVPGSVGLSLGQARSFWKARGVTPTVNGPTGAQSHVVAQTPDAGVDLTDRPAFNHTPSDDPTDYARGRGLLTRGGSLRMALTTAR